MRSPAWAALGAVRATRDGGGRGEPRDPPWVCGAGGVTGRPRDPGGGAASWPPADPAPSLPARFVRASGGRRRAAGHAVRQRPGEDAEPALESRGGHARWVLGGVAAGALGPGRSAGLGAPAGTPRFPLGSSAWYSGWRGRQCQGRAVSETEVGSALASPSFSDLPGGVLFDMLDSAVSSWG